ncbi:hypothetical protein FRB98_001090 [Tulasnella sp. 332]|nr:hypothetical protein FRB98_001090 [Tulasnella sp. 332]
MTTTASSKSASSLGPIRISAYLSRLPSLTHTEFSAHWLLSHAPLVVPWALKFNVINYTQTHLNPDIQANFTGTMKMPLLQYDGLGQMSIGGSIEEFAMAFVHPYYREVIAKDEKRFLAVGTDVETEPVATEIKDRGWETGAIMTAGSAVDIIRDGEVKIEVSDAIWEEWRKWDTTAK